MTKEYAPNEFSARIDRLQSRKEKLPKVLDQRRELYTTVGTGDVKIEPEKISTAVRVGRIREKVSQSVTRLEETARRVDLQIEALDYLQFNRSYDEARRLHNEQHLSDEEMVPFVSQKEQYEQRLEKEPDLREEINKILHEQEFDHDKDEVATFFVMPDGSKLFGIRAHILTLLDKATVDEPVTTLDIGKQVYAGQGHKDSKLRLLVGGNLGSIRDLLEGTRYSVRKVKREEHMTPGYYLQKPSERKSE